MLMTKELKQQFTLKITQANKTQLVVILYEMLLIYLEEARQAHKESNTEEFRTAIKRTKACLHELMASLHFEYELSRHLLALYGYADRQLTKADVRFSTKELDAVESVIIKLHDAYETVSMQDTSAPVMSNTQTVYAGLTYGRNSLTENLADQGSNRGFCV